MGSPRKRLPSISAVLSRTKLNYLLLQKSYNVPLWTSLPMKKTFATRELYPKTRTRRTFSRFIVHCPAVPSMSSWQWSMISETEKNTRGIKQTLSVERVIPIELLYRKRELEVRLRKR